MRNYWGKVDLSASHGPWLARVWPEQGLVDSITYRPVVQTEALLYTTVKENAEAELRQLVDMDGQIIWVRGPQEESKDMPDDDRDWLEEADEEYERTPGFTEVQWVPTGRQGGGSSAFQCERCGCLVLNIDQHQFNCGAHIGAQLPKVWGRIAELSKTLGSRVQGDQWPTVSDRLNWLARRLETVIANFSSHEDRAFAHEEPTPPRDPSDAPGGPEAAARAQRTLDDDWSFLEDIQREASKRLGRAIDRYLKGGK